MAARVKSAIAMVRIEVFRYATQINSGHDLFSRSFTIYLYFNI
jgi:hypothetical protein